MYQKRNTDSCIMFTYKPVCAKYTDTYDKVTTKASKIQIHIGDVFHTRTHQKRV